MNLMRYVRRTVGKVSRSEIFRIRTPRGRPGAMAPCLSVNRGDLVCNRNSSSYDDRQPVTRRLESQQRLEEMIIIFIHRL